MADDLITKIGNMTGVAATGAGILNQRLRETRGGINDPRSISNFKASFDQGIAHGNKFEVVIVPPRNANLGDADALRFRIPMTSLPGRQMNTSSVKRFGIGPEVKRPRSAQYVDLEMTVLCSRDMREYDFFVNWHNSIVGIENTNIVENDGSNHMVSYYDEYVSTLQIQMFDRTNKPIYQAICLEAWPVTIGNAELSWDADRAFMFPVTMAYRVHYNVPQDLNTVDTAQGNFYPQELIFAQRALETGLTVAGITSPIPLKVLDAASVLRSGRIFF